MRMPRCASTRFALVFTVLLGFASLFRTHSAMAEAGTSQADVPASQAKESQAEGSQPRADLPDIETFMQIGYCAQPVLSDDGRTLFFQNSTSGTNQLYRMTDEGWPYQLTFMPDGVDWVSFDHNTQQAVVGAGAGGNERYQLYLLDTTTGSLRALTSESTVRYTAPVWSRDNKRLYYTANDGDPAHFWLYERTVATGEVRKLFEPKGTTNCSDISHDDRLLLWRGSTSSLDANLWIFDLTSGAVTLVTPHQGDIIYGGGAFLAGDREIVLTTENNPARLNRLARIDVATQSLSIFLDPGTPWNVNQLSISENARFLGYVMNEEGYGRLHLFDLERDRELPVPDWKGIIDSPVPTNSGLLAFLFHSATLAPDIWLWDVRGEAGLERKPLPWDPRPASVRDPRARQVTFSSYAGVDRTLFREPELIHYRSKDGREIPAFLYVPASFQKGHPMPFVLDIHGGPEAQTRPDFNRHFQYLMLNGIGVLAPNIRGSSGYGREYQDLDNYTKRKDAIDDVAAAAEWLIAEGYAKRGQVGIKGSSYGGYMTLAALTEYPDLFAAGLDHVGFANFVSFLEQTADYRRTLRESEYGPLTDQAFLESISPLHKADQIRRPLFVVHGENDPRVPVNEARQILRAVRSRGVACDSLIFPDEGHGITRRENRLVFYRRMVEFFSKHLKSQGS